MFEPRQTAKIRFLEKRFRSWEKQHLEAAARCSDSSRCIEEAAASIWRAAADCCESVRTGKTPVNPARRR